MKDAQENNSMNNEIVNLLVQERRRERRWRNIRFCVWVFLILMFAILIYTPKDSDFSTLDASKTPYVSLVRLNGVIANGASFSAEKAVPLLNKAFADKKAKGVVLLINSPGGSAVQSTIIHDKIEQLKQKYHKEVVVVAEDSLASGAYLVATAADKIYVNPATLTGSIGVIMDSFGFDDAIHKLGITRRVFTAGQNKDRLDPFQPLNPQDTAKVHDVLEAVHQDFINDVKQGRQGKLQGDQTELFSGDFWTGEQAVKLGLVDGTANLWDVLKNEFNVSHYKNYAIRPNLWEIFTKGVDGELNISNLGLAFSTPIIKEQITEQ